MKNFFVLKDDMLLTSSKDSTLKVFALHSNMERRENSKIEFDRSAKEILSLTRLEQTTAFPNHVVAILKNAGFVDIWNVAEGKIETTLHVHENSVVRDVLISNGYLIVQLGGQEISKADENKRLIKIYSISSKVNQFLKAYFKIFLIFNQHLKNKK